MTRLLALGDTQLGSGGRLEDQEDVLHRVAVLAIEEQVDGVLHGGDVFEGPTITPEQLQAFAEFVAELRGAGIPVIAICGNGRHDQAMRGPTGIGIFDHIPGIQVATRPDVHLIGGVAVGALPWVHPGRLIALRDGGDRDLVHEDTVELLLRVAEGLREDCEAVAADAPAILLAHWSISGASLPSGLPTDAMHEPILPLVALQELGFDAIVASHIHKPQYAIASQLSWHAPSERFLIARPPIFYTGSPQPHNHGEAGYQHGVWILDLSRASATAEFRPIESRQFLTLEYNELANLDAPVEELPDSAAAVIARVEAVYAPIVRLRYTATRDQARRIDDSALRQAILDAGAHKVTIEPTIVREQRSRVATIHEQLTEREALDLYIAEHEELAPLADGMRARLDRYAAQVPA